MKPNWNRTLSEVLQQQTQPMTMISERTGSEYLTYVIPTLIVASKELQEWFSAFETDLESGKIQFKDYVLFYTTFFLGDKKSESYAPQWKHRNVTQGETQLVQALDNINKSSPLKEIYIFLKEN
ncbi:Integrase [Streptococcus sp. DD10]|nr:Integrase [Streptococcus sp. DD10]